MRAAYSFIRFSKKIDAVHNTLNEPAGNPMLFQVTK